MKTRLIMANIFNLIDAMFTLIVISFGLGIEANPFMAYIIDISPIAFLAVKIIPMCIITMWIYIRNREKETMFGRAASYAVCYSMVVINLINLINFISILIIVGCA